MKIEILYPEFANLYGELENVEYLRQSLKEVQIIQTKLNEKPKFLEEEIDLVYMGAMTESAQEKIIQALKPYQEEIFKKIEEDKVFLFTGNAFEILGQYIQKEDGTKIEGLKILPTYAKRQMMNRYSGAVLGEIEDILIVGFKDQFSHSYGDNSENYFLKVEKGIGLNPDSKWEGFRMHNFFGTYLLGPILILNPKFTKYLIQFMKQEEAELAFEEVAMQAYEKRLEEFKSNRVK